MKKFNAIKLLIEEQENIVNFNKNQEKEKYMNSIYKFTDDYIKPMLEKMTNGKVNFFYDKDDFDDDIKIDNIEKYTEEQLEKEYYKKIYEKYGKETMTLSKRAEQLAIAMVNELGLIEEKTNSEKNKEYNSSLNEQFDNVLTKEEIGFLGKDKKIKQQVAKKICGYISRRIDYDDLLNEYIDKYIIPLLKELGKNGKIKFNLSSNNKDIKLHTEKIIEYAKLTIFHNTISSIAIPLGIKKYDIEIEKYINVLFNDDIEAKKVVANSFIDLLLEEYNNIDFNELPKYESLANTITSIYNDEFDEELPL